MLVLNINFMRNLLYLFVVVLPFAPCDKRICVDVPIVDDEIVENVDTFEVTLERPPGLDSSITLVPVDGIVEISDNDGKYDVTVAYPGGCLVARAPLSRQIAAQIGSDT